MAPKTERTAARQPLRPYRWRSWAVAIASLALFASMAACGSSSSKSADSTSSGAGSGVKSDSTKSAAPVANAVTITSPGMSYSVSGPLKPGVGAITFKNVDDVSHMMAVARLKDGVTVEQVKTALNKSQDEATKLFADSPDNAVYGTPAPVGPGRSTTVTAIDLKAGTYGLVCFFSDDKGVPHFKMGMVSELKVAGTPATEKPKTVGTISIDDKATVLPAGFAGKGTFLVTNTGTAPHAISIARLEPGTSLEQYSGSVGQATNGNKSIDMKGGVLNGGVDELKPGQSAYLTLNLGKGHYGYISPPDAQGPALPPQHGEFDAT